MNHHEQHLGDFQCFTDQHSEPMDSALHESREDDTILALTPEELLDVVNSYESRHKAAAASTSKVKREVSPLARWARWVDSRLFRVERECVHGYLKIPYSIRLAEFIKEIL